VNEAIYTLLGTILGGTIVIFNTYLTNKANFKLEKIKMRGGAKIEAYKNLLSFSESMFHACGPDDDMVKGFLHIMRTSFYQKIFSNYPFYSKKTRNILAEFKSKYDFWGHPDYFDEKENDSFIKNKLIPLTEKLQELSIEEADI